MASQAQKERDMEQAQYELVEDEDGVVTVTVRAANDNEGLDLNGDPEY